MKIHPARLLVPPVHESVHEQERGNVLFIILIAVVLFAALSWAVSQSIKGGDPKTISQEKQKLYAENILSTARAIRAAVHDLRISNGCSDTDISFENVAVAGYEHSPAAMAKCRLFGSAGGGLNYSAPFSSWLDGNFVAQALYGKIYVAGNICVPKIGQGDTGACSGDGQDNEELVLFIPFLKREVCVQVNALLKVANPGGAPPVETGDAWNAGVPKFTGSYGDSVSLDQDGLMAGCFGGSGAAAPPANSYTFFQVLLAR